MPRVRSRPANFAYSSSLYRHQLEAGECRGETGHSPLSPPTHVHGDVRCTRVAIVSSGASAWAVVVDQVGGSTRILVLFSSLFTLWTHHHFPGIRTLQLGNTKEPPYRPFWPSPLTISPLVARYRRE